jgi:hypothetical protein
VTALVEVDGTAAGRAEPGRRAAPRPERRLNVRTLGSLVTAFARAIDPPDGKTVSQSL